MSQSQLSDGGVYLDEPLGDDADALRDKVESLEQELRQARAEVIRLRATSDTATMAVTELRRQLGPLYRAFRAVFGEIELVVGKDDAAPVSATAAPPANGTQSSRWDAIKRGLPPRLAQAVDIVLLHGSMNNSQLAAAMKMDRTNCSNNVTSKLKSMGLFIKNGNIYSLKEL
jgi:hypothetical protein